MLKTANVPLTYLQANKDRNVRQTIREMFGIPNDRRIIAVVRRDSPSMSFQVTFVEKHDRPLVDTIFTDGYSKATYFKVGGV